MRRKRPVNLDLTTIHFPITAIISILHRISGVVIFLFLPVLIYWLHLSLNSEMSFAALQNDLANPLIKFLLWIVLSAVIFHLYAGIRHLTMDLGFAESLTEGRVTAFLVILLAVVTALLLGAWLWL